MVASDDNHNSYPERRLWCAVIISTMEEYEEWCIRIHTGWHVKQKPVSGSYKFAIQHIRRQCKGEWFQTICELADFPASRMSARFDQLDKEYCIAVIPFEGEDQKCFLSPWELRKRAHRKLAN